MYKNGQKFDSPSERIIEFTKFCEKHFNKETGCKSCPIYRDSRSDIKACIFYWLELEVDKEKPAQCPYCNGNVGVEKDGKLKRMSCACGYRSGFGYDEKRVIEDHNRFARAARKVLEELRKNG